MDQGAIKNFKMFYRKEIVTQLLDCGDENRELKVSVLDAKNFVHKLWKNVSQQVIWNGFAHCSFYDNQ